MSPWVMVDSSSWSHALRRRGNADIRARVQRLLTDQTAAWCEMIRLELWGGVRNDLERQALDRLDQTLPRLPITNEVWNSAVVYASKSRAAGLTVPAADLLIFACAKAYGAGLEHADRHYELLESLSP